MLIDRHHVPVVRRRKLFYNLSESLELLIGRGRECVLEEEAIEFLRRSIMMKSRGTGARERLTAN